MSWKPWHALDSTVVISRISMRPVNAFMTWSRMRLLSTGHTNTKNYFNQSKTDLAKTRSLLCLPRTISFIFTWIHRTMALAASSSNSSLREKELFPSPLEFLTKPNRRYLLFIENFAYLFQIYKLLNTTSLDLPFLYTFIVTTNRFFIYGDERDFYHIGSLGIK